METIKPKNIFAWSVVRAEFFFGTRKVLMSSETYKVCLNSHHPYWEFVRVRGLRVETWRG